MPKNSYFFKSCTKSVLNARDKVQIVTKLSKNSKYVLNNEYIFVKYLVFKTVLFHIFTQTKGCLLIE